MSRARSAMQEKQKNGSFRYIQAYGGTIFVGEGLSWSFFHLLRAVGFFCCCPVFPFINSEMHNYVILPMTVTIVVMSAAMEKKLLEHQSAS